METDPPNLSRFASLPVTTVLLLALVAAVSGQQPSPSPAPDPRLDPPRIQIEGEPVEMSLAEVVVLTFEQNLDLEIRRLEVENASDEVDGTLGIYDPTLAAAAQRSRSETELNSNPSAGAAGAGTQTFVAEENVDTYSVSLNQLLPTGGRIGVGFSSAQVDLVDSRAALQVYNPVESQRAFVRLSQPLLKNFGPTVTNLGIRVARLQERIASAAYRQEVENRLANVMSAYWELVFAIRNLEVQRASLEAALELERVNEVRVRTGASPRSDLFQAQARVAERRNNVISAKSAILAAQDRLLQFLNWPETPSRWNRPVMPSDTPDEYDLQVEYDDNNLIDDAYGNRYDLEAVRIGERLAEETRDAAWWQRLPELNFVAEYGLNGLDGQSADAFQDIQDSRFEDYFYGLELRYPLLNRRARADYRQARRNLDLSRLDLQNLQLAILTEVRAATRTIRTAQESIDASKAQVRAAEELLTSEQRRLEVGASTTFNVLEFQEDLTAAQVAEVRALVDYQRGLIELERSRGTLLTAIAQQLSITFDFGALPEYRLPK